MRLHRFLTDRRGAAAIELALIAPLAAGLVAASFGVWNEEARRGAARSALQFGAEYYMNGGGDDVAAQTLSQSAWRNRPARSTLSVQRDCRCGVAILACTSLCTGQKPPAVYVTLRADGMDPTALYSPSISEKRVVRVR